MSAELTRTQLLERGRAIYESLPEGGLFAGLNWLIALKPFEIERKIYDWLEALGRVLLQFYRSANLLYRQSIEGRQPSWVAELLDKGKPPEIIRLQRAKQFKNELPRVIRPDLLLTQNGLFLTELDSVPGGIGLTDWLNKTYFELNRNGSIIIGGKNGMFEGFSLIFGDSKSVKIIISEESASYLPEMQWIQNRHRERFSVNSVKYQEFNPGDSVYRFFELFDYRNIKNFELLTKLALDGKIYVTPPFKSFLEEKMLLAFLWNRNLREFWRKELGEAFFERLLNIVPYSWVVDPQPLPPQAVIPRLELSDWQQLKTLSQKQRQLILNISGFSELAWGARGVYLGSDLSSKDWAEAVDTAIKSFNANPYILQEYKKPAIIRVQGYDPMSDKIVEFDGRVRLSPYYFVVGDWNNARTRLGGVLATICPSDKKIIHGMRDAVLAPCCYRIDN